MISETKALMSSPTREVPSSPCACGSLKRHKQQQQQQQQQQEQQHADSSLNRLLEQWLGRNIEMDAIYFGVRMAVCLTISSLFVLAQSPSNKHHFPEGMWVLITVLFVCWFPTLDAASVLEKSIQRLIGTLIGASVGLLCGFVSLLFANKFGVHAQAISIGTQLAIFSFSVCSYAVHIKAIPRYNYAVILCNLTYVICLMPFYSADPNWQKSIYRVTNVIIGCFLGVGLSMVIFPRPTVCIIQDKISKQIVLAGEASETVLHTAADVFADKTYEKVVVEDEILIVPPALLRSIRTRMPTFRRKWKQEAQSALGHDRVLEKYEEATKEYREARSQLGMLHYDPFNIGRPNDLLGKFRTETANTLTRAMRIQTTVVLIDGIVRNDPKHTFSSQQLELLANVGTLIRQMLAVPLDIEASDTAAQNLTVDLATLRRMIVDLSATVSTEPSLQVSSIIPEDSLENNIGDSRVDFAGRGMYGSTGSLQSLAENQFECVEYDNEGSDSLKHVQGSHACSLLFLQLAEHLALRSVRLYASWKKMEGVCAKAEHLRDSIRGRVALEV